MKESRLVESFKSKRKNDPATPMSRRSFLELGAAGAILPRVASAASSARTEHIRPDIPSLADLASDEFTHRFITLYAVAAAQNEWGYLKVTKSVAGITSISFPPFACCGVPTMPWSPGFLLTCEIFLNGRILMAYEGGERVTYKWFPHRIVRQCRAQGLHFTTQTFMPSRQRAAAEEIKVTNESGERRDITLAFDLRAGVTVQKDKPWFVDSPAEADNRRTWEPSHGCLIFEAQHSRAVAVQGLVPRPVRCQDGRMLVCEFSLGPGESKVLQYLNVIDDEPRSALESYSRGQAGFGSLLKQNEDTFSSLIRSAFTPGNPDFSGHLPQLHTRDESLWKLYYTGFTNLLAARRASPDSSYGTTYLTLAGQVLPTLSFPWDTSLTSLSLAMLDPAALRRLIEAWFIQPMDRHLATDYVTGKAVGPWYGVNDMAIVRCAYNYLRVSGDFPWLDKPVGEKTALEHLFDHATHWKKLDTHGHGLGDYGGMQNLLEVVSTYVHEVAGMNAGNVFSMRFVAQLLEKHGDSLRAAQLRREAKALADRINRRLYVQGKGYWKCELPDGTFNKVRHCYDLLSMLDNMFADLSANQKKEMSDFFWRELHDPLWMHALSPKDADATWNIRPDHSWLGAYAGWPPMTAKGLYKIDDSQRVAEWLKGLAKAGNQGPFGQAHFVETVWPPAHGGATKCPEDAPYLTDWACIAGGCFVDMVMESVFGINLTLDDGIKATPRVDDFDPGATLVNLNYQGTNYSLTRAGVEKGPISGS